MDSSVVVLPSTSTKAQTSTEVVIAVVQRLYGIDVEDIRKVDSWDDQNFYILSTEHKEFTFKIVNATDSLHPQYIDAQHAIAEHLADKGFVCPKPVVTVAKHYRTLERFLPGKGEEENRLVHMLTFVPGTLLHNNHVTVDMLHQCGKYVAQLRNALMDFDHKGFKDHSTIYNLECAPLLLDFMKSVRDQNQRKLYMDVIQTFEKRVLNRYNKLTKSVIHGDFSTRNIIVRDGLLHGVIDFGDSVSSACVFDLAVAATGCMADCRHIPQLDVAGHMITAYKKVAPLSEFEIEVLPLAIAARYATLGVMSEHQYSLHGEKHFIEECSYVYGDLNAFWNYSAEEINGRWDELSLPYK